MIDRFICIHGHFYQPPRENPWLEDVEVEDSAAPYHDWNERIAAECYAPNAASRILDGDERIISLANNYEKMSFNFGPTLLSWLERHRSDVYGQILEADRTSRRAHNGHGNALAQCYNHVIMPLAGATDKRAQVRWGIADFQFRFGRKPEGMWLPETAVDLETLQILAASGIKFTILAPGQARAVRAPGGDWQDVSSGRIDPTRAYRCRLRDGTHIDLFFYDQRVSHEISFEGLLASGDRFVDRLMSGFRPGRDYPQLINIATDGETFGHHSRFGDMALAYAISRIEREGIARITNYAEYLELYPPTHEVMIAENTSWSCAHGVERWRSDCGCNSGNTHYHQRWRAPLRRALDSLQEKLDGIYGRESSLLLLDPYGALDDYIDVILHRSPANTSAFLSKQARRELSEAEQINVWRLLEMQRCARLMYTSCGWFFDDISNIETVKILEFAARAIQLAREAGGVDLEPGFITDLRGVPGNIPRLPNGAEVYRELARPSMASLEKGLAHYAISSLVEDYSPRQRIFSFEFERADYLCEKTSSRTLAIGAVNVRSTVTGERYEGMFVLLHLGGYDFHCVVRPLVSPGEYNTLKGGLFRRFREDSTRNLLQAIDTGIVGHGFSLGDLFIDERRKIGRLLARDALERSRDHYRRIYEESRDVMRLLASMRVPSPDSLNRAVEYVLGQRIEQACSALKSNALSESALTDVTEAVLREAEALGCKVDLSSLRDALEQVVHSRLEAFGERGDYESVESALRVLRLAKQLGVDLELWRLQNLFWELAASAQGRSEAVVGSMRELAEQLRFSSAVIRFELIGYASDQG